MWRTLAAPFREFGFAAGLLYAADRVLRRLSPRLGLYVYEMMAQPITGQPLLPAGRTRHLGFAEIGEGSPEVAAMPAREDIKAARFAQGARCLGVYRKGVLIGYLWYCRERYEEDEIRCTYELVDRERSVFDFDLYVLPEHRMGTAFLSVWHAANLFLGERGVHYTFSRLTRFNLASRRAHSHLGWRRVGRVVALKAGGVELLVSTIAPFAGLTWRPDQRVGLRLAPDVLAGRAVGTAGPAADGPGREVQPSGRS